MGDRKKENRKEVKLKHSDCICVAMLFKTKEIMRKQYLFSTLLIILISYLSISFVLMQWNVTLWDMSARIFLVIITIFVSGAYILIKEE